MSGSSDWGRVVHVPATEREFSWRPLLHLTVLTAAAVAVRLLFIASYPTGWDDVDFALALNQYDLSRMQPHFPGYPVYILLGHLFDLRPDNPFFALSLLSAVAGGFTIIPLWLLFHRMGPAPVARLAVWLYSLAPLPLVMSIQPMSDSLGAFFAAWVAYCAWRAADGMGCQLVAAGVALGLLLGVRVSYLPLAALWLYAILYAVRRREIPVKWRVRSAVISAGAVGVTCFVWLAALVHSTGGIDSFLTLALSFTGGHFSDWGGAYHAGDSLAERAKLFFLRQIGAAGVGTVWWENDSANGHPATWSWAFGWRWIGTISVFVGIAGLVGRLRLRGPAANQGEFRLTRKQAAFLFIWIVPYLLWAFFAQNVEKPRHILPLLPPILYLLAAGMWRFSAFAAQQRFLQRAIFTMVGVVWLAGVTGVSVPLLREAHAAESPMMQLARYVAANVPVDDSLIFAWEEQRVLNYVTPAHTVIRLRKWEDFRTEILQYEKPPARIFATNALLDGMDRDVRGLFREVREFRGNPWLYPTYHTIVLYEAAPLLYDQLRQGKGELAWKSKRY
ncbi:ArnT family glycosyltransferase [Effusibacillus pohliae]|uniref:ArnT family glycosyltransferase n=1 Tax=Effusibacillus pohliae TaxID=232270 RepID=UPI00035EE332|nr:glycosyltransferase family 39 protein [Effusibacillus pohliae]